MKILKQHSIVLVETMKFLHTIEWFFHAISMSLMQVGEMANKLSAEFKERTNGKVNWYKLKAIRNLFAHAYSNINKRNVWQFATVFTPVYTEFCRQEIIILQNKNS